MTTGTSTTQHTTVRRQIHADPTSTALLLAAPSAFELWPGVERVAVVAGRAVVEAELATRRHAAATVRALPPRRTPTSYLSRFEWVGPGLPATSAELTLSFVPTGDGTLETEAVLTLDSTDPMPELEDLAAGFLANLATAAELRSRAA